MKRRELFKLIKNPPTYKNNYSSIKFGFGYTPYPDNNATLNSAYIGSLYYQSYENNTTGEIFNSILVYNGKDYLFRCGDIFLEAKLSVKRAEKLTDIDINSFEDEYKFKLRRELKNTYGILGGKTFLIHNWCKKVKIKEIFLGEHEQLESIDFLGHYIQNKDGSFLWKDGALTEAFREAEKGNRVVLIIDEILRIPKRELNILIYSLIAWNDKYILRTGRAMSEVDDVATEETIYAPKNKIWVVGTTNVGSGYAVEEIDEALADRFRIIRKDSTRAEMERILIKYVKKKKFSKISIFRLIRFFSEMRRYKSQDILNKIINIRHLVEAIEFSNMEDEIADILKDTILAWVDRDLDGYPHASQVEIIEKLIDDIWDLDKDTLQKEHKDLIEIEVG